MMNKKLIPVLAEKVLQKHSFSYQTVDEAIMRVQSEKYYCAFDATSLYIFQHNLNEEEYASFCDTLRTQYKLLHGNDKEWEKERKERFVLNRFLLTGANPYREYLIKKEQRPDFVLKGNTDVGIEVVRLTTELTQHLFAASDETRNKNYNEKQLKEHVKRFHRHYKDQFQFFDHEDNIQAGIGSGIIDIHKTHVHFAEEIANKYDKYKELLSNYQDFIILCDAFTGVPVEITSQDEVNRIIASLRERRPDVRSITVAILWDPSPMKYECTIVKL